MHKASKVYNEYAEKWMYPYGCLMDVPVSVRDKVRSEDKEAS